MTNFPNGAATMERIPQEQGGCSLWKKALITKAYQLLSRLNAKATKAVNKVQLMIFDCKELLNTTLKELKTAEKLDNSILIDLERILPTLPVYLLD